jgi:glycosyltransferase involved in cell wall biosynthesis
MNKLIRILHLVTTLDVGGAEIALYRLLASMDHSKFDCRVISLVHPGSVGEKITALGVVVESLNMERGRPSYNALCRLTSLLRKFQPHILQTWLYHADLLGIIAGRLSGVPSIIWNLRASDMDMSRYRALSGWTRRACALLSSWPQAIVTNSSAGRAYHESIGYRPRRWEMIPNGIDLERFRPDNVACSSVHHELGLDANTILIGYVARYDPMKDHGTFFQAAKMLMARDSDIHFLLCGNDIVWDNAALVQLIDAAGLRDRVHLLGNRADIPRITSALDVATSASISEGFANVILEAMACGVPCVVTDVGDSASIVGETGVVVAPGNPRALYTGWSQLITMDAVVRQKLGATAHERVSQQYRLGKITQQYEALYQSIRSLDD